MTGATQTYLSEPVSSLFVCRVYADQGVHPCHLHDGLHLMREGCFVSKAAQDLGEQY